MVSFEGCNGIVVVCEGKNLEEDLRLNLGAQIKSFGVF
jgi:hypothetical protein